MKIAAHRGASSLAPENTISAFKKAAEIGCEWIEIDVQLTQDNVPVVIHDQTVNRCTNGTGIVAETNLKELKVLDAGLWFNESFRGETIPTLEETLQLANTHNLHINIELKIYPGDDVILLCDKVNQVINSATLPLSSILFSSFDISAIKYLHRTQPNVKRGQLWEKIPHDAVSHLKEIDAFSAHCDYRYLEEEQAKKIKQENYKICCYTANIPAHVEPHKSWGVDMVFSDMPQIY